MRVVMPAEFIRLPARMKNGTAISGKELMPLTMLARTMIGGMPLVMTKASEDSARAKATGTPMTIRTSSNRIMIRIDMAAGLQSDVRLFSIDSTISSGAARMRRHSHMAA